MTGCYILTRLIIAKGQVNPLKHGMIPRLELYVTHSLAHLAYYCLTIYSQLHLSHVHLWGYTSVELTWIQTPPYRLKTYIANRVAQVQELLPCWHHDARDMSLCKTTLLTALQD